MMVFGLLLWLTFYLERRVDARYERRAALVAPGRSAARMGTRRRRPRHLRRLHTNANRLSPRHGHSLGQTLVFRNRLGRDVSGPRWIRLPTVPEFKDALKADQLAASPTRAFRSTSARQTVRAPQPTDRADVSGLKRLPQVRYRRTALRLVAQGVGAEKPPRHIDKHISVIVLLPTEKRYVGCRTPLTPG